MKYSVNGGEIHTTSTGESTKIITGNLDKIKLDHKNDGKYQITPFILFQAGDDNDDNGEEYVEAIAAELNGKLDVPYFITGMPINIFVVAEV